MATEAASALSAPSDSNWWTSTSKNDQTLPRLSITDASETNSKKQINFIGDAASLPQSQQGDNTQDLLAETGLDTYPQTAAERQADNERLDAVNQNLPKNSFSEVMLEDMKKLGLDNVDIWYGSNIQLDGTNGNPGDGGALYRKWCELAGIEPRESSHDHLGQEYQILTGLGNTAVLFGLDKDGNTFFQVEHNYAGGPEHGQDYQLYRALNQNIGGLGVSPHTDKNPIEVDYPIA